MNNNYDVIIVGTGAAGLFAGLCLPADLKVLMITKDKVENSDSYLAQGCETFPYKCIGTK